MRSKVVVNCWGPLSALSNEEMDTLYDACVDTLRNEAPGVHPIAQLCRMNV